MAQPKKKQTGVKIGEAEIRRISVEANCDPRTVRRVLLGESGAKAEARVRARRALVAAGFLPPEPTP